MKKQFREFEDAGIKKLSNIEKHNQMLPFDKAREFVRALGLKNYPDWYAYCKSGKRQSNIPAYPNETYKKEWKGMPDFLGIDRIANKDRKFKSFKEARKFVRLLNLKSQREWNTYSKSDDRPGDIPANPPRKYKKEWISWPDWLGNDSIAPQNMVYQTFESAKKFVRELKLKNREEWVKFSKSSNKPTDIPTDPSEVYKNEWTSWGDWLGNGTIANQVKSKLFLPIEEAKPLYQKLFKEYGIKNGSDWIRFARTHGKLLDKLRLPTEPLVKYDKKNAKKKLKK